MTDAERKQHARWMKAHPLYEVYSGIMKRTGIWKCNNLTMLKDYRDRGIGVCDEWVNSFADFEKWAYANGYSNGCGLHIDRIDNDRGYYPDNCRWVKRKENNRNKRDTIVIDCGGEVIPLIELYEKMDAVVPYTIFRNRVKTGWSIVDAAYTNKRKITDPKFKRK